MPDMLITAAENLNGVHVDSIRPHTGLLEAHRELLELIDHIAAADDKLEKLQVLADEAPTCCASDGARHPARLARARRRQSWGAGDADSHRAVVPLDHAEALDERDPHRSGATWTPRWPPHIG